MSDKRRIGDQQPLKGLLQGYLEKSKLQQGLEKVQIKELWHKELGPGVSRYTSDVVLKGDTLIVYLESSVLRQELSYGRSKIINLLNDAMGKELIKELVLR